MADIDLKTETPDTTLPTTGFLFGADSQAAASPSVYSTQTVATTLLGSTTLTGATVTTSQPVIDASQTWNDGGVTFTGLKFNAATGSNTGSAAGSLLMDLQLEGNSLFRFGKDGRIYVTGGSSRGLYGYSPSTSGGIAINGSAVLILENGQISTSATLVLNGSTLRFSSDLFLTRRAAANLRLGAADAAAPVAQTLSVQSVVAGTSNTAGANLTITGSQGTGTGAGGSIIFQVAPAGSSGTAQNALVDALTINSAQQALFANGSLSAPSISFASETNSGFYRAAAATFALSIGGVATHIFTLTSFRGRNNSYSYYFGTSDDVVLTRDAANTLALRNGTNAQESRVYGSYTSATNFQRMSIKTLRESSGALSGASYTTTIAIPAYANLIGVTTRVTTEVTGATTYDVGDGTDVDLWGAAIGVALGSQSRTADFTAVGAVGAAATSRTVTLTANGSNFTGGVVEICLHYITTEAD